MKFIQLKDGVSIKKDQIIMIERLEEGGTRITTDALSVESIFPYETILSLVENDAIEEMIKKSVARETLPDVNLWGQQHFAG